MSGPLRRAAVLMIAAALAATTSGCAAAARGLLVLDTVTTVQEIAGADDGPDGGTDDATGTAVVDGTGDAGLRLRDEPGGHRITALPEGTVVRWTCRRSGPGARGPRGTTTDWARVTTADGATGFASGAYLRGREDVSELPLCSAGRG